MRTSSPIAKIDDDDDDDDDEVFEVKYKEEIIPGRLFVC